LSNLIAVAYDDVPSARNVLETFGELSTEPETRLQEALDTHAAA
jgi:hypothetical protein